MAMRSAAPSAPLCRAILSESEQTHATGGAGQNPHAGSFIVEEGIIVDDTEKFLADHRD
jgi:hypothetical protein